MSSLRLFRHNHMHHRTKNPSSIVRTFSGINEVARPRLQRPPPGRLPRLPRESSATAISSNDIKLKFEDEEVKRSRIDERKEAIARRRLLLEKGVSSLEAVEDDKRVETEVTHKQTNEVSNLQNESKASTPRMARSSVHSLIEGRKLSAADLHRLHRTTRRSESEQQQQTPTQQTIQTQRPLQEQNKVDHRLTRAIRSNPTGGSVVAAQSATTRYRMQRQQQRDAADTSESNLKMNPSVISIPLDETSDTNLPKLDDFEERLEKLRKEKQKEEREDWSLFGWLWKK